MKYNVTLTRTVTESAVVTVDAINGDEAGETALELAESYEVDFHADEPSNERNDKIYVDDIEEA